MSIDVTPSQTLSRRVAAEIRAEMARQQMSGRTLAARLGRSPNWVSLKVSGSQKLDLDDLDVIAQSLGLTAGTLLARSAGITNPSHTLVPGQRPQMARNATRNVRPSDRRPIGRSQTSTGPNGQRRTSRVAQ